MCSTSVCSPSFWRAALAAGRREHDGFVGVVDYSGYVVTASPAALCSGRRPSRGTDETLIFNRRVPGSSPGRLIQ